MREGKYGVLCGHIFENNEWRQQYNRKLYDILQKPNFIIIINFSRLGWTGHLMQIKENEHNKRILNAKPFENGRVTKQDWGGLVDWYMAWGHCAVGTEEQWLQLGMCGDDCLGKPGPTWWCIINVNGDYISERLADYHLSLCKWNQIKKSEVLTLSFRGFTGWNIFLSQNSISI